MLKKGLLQEARHQKVAVVLNLSIVWNCSSAQGVLLGDQELSRLILCVSLTGLADAQRAGRTFL